MQIKLLGTWLKKLGINAYCEPDKWRSIDLNDLTDEQQAACVELAAQAKGVKGAAAVIQKIQLYGKILDNADSTLIDRLEAVPLAADTFFSGADRGWMFTKNRDNRYIAWKYVGAEYQPYDDNTHSPAYARLSFVATRNRSSVSHDVTLYVKDIRRTIVDMMAGAGLKIPTEKLMEAYNRNLEWYEEIKSQTGAQFTAIGVGFADAYGELFQFEVDGYPTKVVMDDEHEENSFSHSSRTHSRNSRRSSSSDDEGEEDADAETGLSAIIPVQPLVKVFALDRHDFVNVHVANLRPYQWTPQLMEKLVLPVNHLNLISMLVNGADLVMEDIVQGKTGGIVVICTGPSGTGKTLTSEIFSEGVKKPLYSVQCSQLGTSEVKLEEMLQVVLRRAERWKAILLIDEADVYVHERGSDIRQNAIVGVFLRLLERYRGVLFLTSNRSTVIDDAIMSRATAWIRYELPNQDDTRRIWKVLGAQYGVYFSDETITTLVEHPQLQGISGRSVKNLLQLARRLAKSREDGGTVTVDDIVNVSQFLDLECSARQVNAKV